MNPLLILGVALAISMAGNAGLTYAYLGQRDETTAAQGERDNARAAASACSDATEALAELSAKRAKEATAARLDAAAKARSREELADAILNTPASDADDCKAASDRAAAWLKGRQ